MNQTVDYETRIVSRLKRDPFTLETRITLWDRCGGRCVYCGSLMNPWRDWSIDHIVSLQGGGSDELDNLVGCCKQCNRRKRGRPLWAWRRQFLSFHDKVLDQRARDEQPEDSFLPVLQRQWDPL